MVRKARVLLVEDEKIIARILVEALAEEGYEVYLAHSGSEAMAYLDRYVFDAAILDLVIPQPTGMEILAKINPRLTKTCVIITTAYPSFETMRKAYSQERIFDYMIRPFKAAELLSVLQEGLAERKRRLELDALVKGRAKCILTIHYSWHRVQSFSFEGAVNYPGESRSLKLDLDDLNDELQEIGDDIFDFHKLLRLSSSDQAKEQYQEKRDRWRSKAILRGQELYTQIIGTNTQLVEQWGHAKQAVGLEKDMVVRFRGPRTYLGMPYEMLHDGQAPLVACYPLCRQVEGVGPKGKSQTFSSFLERLKDSHLKVLLIASESGSSLEEIRLIHDLVQEKLVGIGIEVG